MGIGIRKLVRIFEDGNIEVTGRKGAGKDVMFGNVIARIKRPYISNIDYTHDDRFISLDMSKLDCGQNIYVNFIEGDIKYYIKESTVIIDLANQALQTLDKYKSAFDSFIILALLDKSLLFLNKALLTDKS